MKNYDTINELIQYKIDKGYKMHDTNNIRPIPETTKYYKYVLSPEKRIKYNDELEEKEEDKDFKEYMKTKKEPNKGPNNDDDDYDVHFPEPDGLDWFPPTK